VTHYVPDINLLKIDLDSIDDVDENAETVVFDILLNGHPTSRWIEEFEILYNRTPFSIKPPVIVDGDRMHIHFLPRYQGDLQAFVDFLSTMVHQATSEARLTESIKINEAKEERKKEFRSILAQVSLLPTPGRS
jgi:hypothetical protein